jgi:hypothetical protein
MKSFHTFVWLGPEANDSARAISLLGLFAKGRGMLKLEMPTQGDLFSSEEAAQWIALYKFLDRPYWKRVWIIQELIISFSIVTVFCGKTQLSLENLAVAVKSISENFLALKEHIRVAHRSVGLLEPPVSIKTLLACIRLLNMPFLDMIKHKDHRTLPLLLDLSRTSEQTDLKDKLYAILGLLDRDIVRHITPDYDLPLWKVFTSLPKAMITATGRLDILRQCTLEDENDRTVPSWVPDLTTIIHTNDISTNAAFNASGETPAIFQFIQDDRGLVVLGFRIDAVDGLGCTSWDTIGSESSITQPSTNSAAYDTERAVRKALYRSLIAAEKEEAGMGYLDSWERFFGIPVSAESAESVIGFLAVNKGLQVGGRNLEEWFSSNTNHLETPAAVIRTEKLYSRMLVVNTYRRLMTTSQARIGVAPKAAKQGDIICILFGSSIPMVVRPIPDFENCFTLVGECYVEGVMDGEALGWRLAEKRDL